MKEVIIQIQLETETIFGVGSTRHMTVDSEVLYDDYGMPYLMGKTFKGKLRAALEDLANGAEQIWLQDKIELLFGTEGDEKDGILKFSQCTLPQSVQAYLIQGIDQNLFTKEEVLESLTTIRVATAIGENGIALKGSLRQYRVIQKGLVFQCHLLADELDEEALMVLAIGCRALKQLGKLESRGKGYVTLSLIEEGQDVTQSYIDAFGKKVVNA